MAKLKEELTTRDLSRMFNVSRQSIYVWRRKYKIPYFKVGGNGLSDPTRYKLEDVQEFAARTKRSIINPIYVPD